MIDEVFPLSLIPDREVSSVWKKPTTVYNLMIQMDSDMRPRLSFTAVQEGVLYRVYRLQDGAESLVAELTGRPAIGWSIWMELHGDSPQLCAPRQRTAQPGRRAAGGPPKSYPSPSATPCLTG